ncbi:MAG: NAD(P)H-dependent oxidoreductase [Gammaproteobacteria bacterium]|nr:NAD(P)H-dependent oxidoreductase [Gammaproteobacteria bacterium]
MQRTLSVLGIAGSLRRDSYNRALLRAAHTLAPDRMQIEICELDAIPLYNQDQESPLPAAVEEMKKRIRTADAILIATPEYNYSVPGVLKNAIDWCSRPFGESAWTGKPVAVIGASSGAFGTARAQAHLRQIFVTLDMHPLNKPEILVGNAGAHIDATGQLHDEKTRELLKQLLQTLATWTEQLSAVPQA